jgi:hypothetical protein
MDNIDILRSQFQSEWNNNGIYHAKNFIKNLPTWEEIIKILNKEIRTQDNNLFTEPSSKNFEIVYKDIVAMKKLSYSDEKRRANSMKPNLNDHSIESDATFFFSLFFKKERLHKIVSKSLINEIKNMNKSFDINTYFVSLKIALSDKVVAFESHKENTCVIQLAGTNIWNLRNRENGLEKSYLVEPGDCLFFKENIEHELTNEEPRSSIVGRFEFGKSYE